MTPDEQTPDEPRTPPARTPSESPDRAEQPRTPPARPAAADPEPADRPAPPPAPSPSPSPDEVETQVLPEVVAGASIRDAMRTEPPRPSEPRPSEPRTSEPSAPSAPASSAPSAPAGSAGPEVVVGADVQQASRVEPGGTGGPSAAWRRLREGLRPSRGQAIVAVVLGLVAFLAVVQVRQNLAGDGYANARREDLIEILDGLGQSTRRLESEIADLEARKTKLSSGADRAENARAQAQEQVKVLGILAGTLPAQGPGVKITLSDPNGKVESSNLLDAIEELRDAGAEAIQINGRVRVVASTAFTDDPPGIRVDAELVQAPYVIEAIGDAHNLSEAANFPGGLVSEITGPQVNGTAEVNELSMVRITALHTPQEHRYARPAASPTK